MYMLILPAVLIPIRDQFGLSTAQITYLATICYSLYGIMALPGGILADKLSYKAVLAIFFIGTPTAACIVGSARSVTSLGIGLALLGLFASLYHPSGLAMISQGVRERGKALGLHGVFGSLGLALSQYMARSLATRFSWRQPYYFLSLPGFIAGAVFLLVSRTALRTEQPDAALPKDPAENVPQQSRQRFSIWSLILLYAAMTLMGFAYRGVVTMLPTYLGKFGIGLALQSDLDSGRISSGLRQEFKNNKTELSQNATIPIEESRLGSKWQIKDEGKNYTVINEKSGLSVYGRRTARGALFATLVYLVGMLGQYMGPLDWICPE